MKKEVVQKIYNKRGKLVCRAEFKDEMWMISITDNDCTTDVYLISDGQAVVRNWYTKEVDIMSKLARWRNVSNSARKENRK